MANLTEINVFKALSETLRFRIVMLLFSGELCVCDLMSVLSLPQSTVSRHISRLKTTGLVTDRREGKWVFYKLTDSIEFPIENLKEILSSFEDKQPYKSDLEKLKNYQVAKECR